MFTETETLTIDMLSSGTAIMDSTKPGSLTKDSSTTQDKFFQMDTSSNSDQEWEVQELSLGTTTLEVINTNLRSKTISHGT